MHLVEVEAAGGGKKVLTAFPPFIKLIFTHKWVAGHRGCRTDIREARNEKFKLANLF